MTLASASEALRELHTTTPLRKKQFLMGFLGAGDRFRTDDLVLGKHALYQLSYTRPVQKGRPRVVTARPTSVKSSHARFCIECRTTALRPASRHSGPAAR